MGNGDWRGSKHALPRDFREPALRGGPHGEQLRYWGSPDLWSEKALTFLRMFEAFHLRELEATERLQLGRCQELLAQLLALAPQHAMGCFLSGLCQYLVGDVEQAGRMLQAAARFDAAPRKASSITNGMLREIASDQPGVACFDAEAIWRSRFAEGLIGFELMKDDCHLHEGARLELMQDFAPVLLELWSQLERQQ